MTMTVDLTCPANARRARRAGRAGAIGGGALAALVASAGCGLDTRMVVDPTSDVNQAPAPIVVSSFENGNAEPDDPRFDHWQYFAYNPPVPDLPEGAFVHSPMASPGFAGSQYAVATEWTLIDVPDGALNYPGVGQVCATIGSIDLSSYSRISFAHLDQHDDGPCLATPAITFELGCSEYNTSFEVSVPTSPQWTLSEIPFDQLHEPAWKPATGTARADCLAVMDHIIITLQPVLADGQCGSGSFLMDNIAFR
jgi:hypothetical protein